MPSIMNLQKNNTKIHMGPQKTTNSKSHLRSRNNGGTIIILTLHYTIEQ